LERVNIFNYGTALRPGLLGTLVRTSLDSGSATEPDCHKPPVLLWLFLVLSFLLALPYTSSLTDKVCLWNSCLLSIPGLADTVSSPRWYARTAGSLLREVSFQMEALYWRTPLYSFLPLNGYI
jgi:hypothetical protein